MRKTKIAIILFLIAVLLVGVFVYKNKDRESILLSDNERQALNDIGPTQTTESDIAMAKTKIDSFHSELKNGSKDKTKYYLYIAIAQQYELLGNGENTAVNLFLASKQENDRSLPFFKLGDLFEKAELFNRAEEYYEKAIDTEPQIVQNHRGLLNLYIEKMSVGKSRVQSTFDDARSETGDDIDVLRMYAKWLTAESEYLRAIDILRFILRENPTDKEEIEKEILRLTQLINEG